MERFYAEKRNVFGRVEPGASVTVFIAGTDNLATIYGATDPAIDPLVSIPNPFTSDSDGRIGFTAPNGSYDVVVVGGDSSVWRRRITLFDLSSSSSLNLNANQIQFNTSPTGINNSEGNLYYDPNDRALNLVLNPSMGTVLQVGQEMYINCVNKTGTQINDGSVVYIDDAQGNRPTCSLASASTISKSNVIGIATESILPNQAGFVTTFGIVHGFDTRPFLVDGAAVYLSTSPGQLTATPPDYPNQVVSVGTTLNTTINGSVFVHPDRPQAYGTDASNTTFDKNGMQFMHGAASVWDDWNLGIDYTPQAGAGVPNYNVFVGGIKKYQFAVNDSLQYEGQEFLHDWAEGSDISVHVHWVTGGTNNATVRGVKWEIEFTYCNPLETGSGATAFVAFPTVSAESSISANQPDRTHRISHIATITPTGMKIGANITVKLKRIASVINVAPVNDPFVINLGIHYQKDTLGSRQISSK